MNRTSLLRRILRGTGHGLVGIKLALTLLVIVFAATITVDPTKTFTGEIGSTATAPGGLLVTDRGFTTATITTNANATCTAPATFGPLPVVANNNVTSGDITYNVRVNSTSTATPLAKFNVTFTLGTTSFGPLCIQTTATPADGQIIDCKFDIGTTALPASIYTFKVTISDGF